MKNLIRPAIISFVALTLITGIAYPALVTLLARVAFPTRSAGSIIVVDGKTMGSDLIGQTFDAPGYFWSRPSATNPAYNAAASSGSNLGPTNPALAEAIHRRTAALKAADPGNDTPVPVDLVTASASGLDPHISVDAAEYQARRVARVRHLPAAVVERLIRENTQARTFGVLGEARVNVLRLNLALDQAAPQT